MNTNKQTTLQLPTDFNSTTANSTSSAYEGSPSFLHYALVTLMFLATLALVNLRFEWFPMLWQMDELIAIIGSIYAASTVLTLAVYLKQSVWDRYS